MKSRLLTILFLLVGGTVLGQINSADATVQAIAYWEKGAKQTYTVSMKTIKLNGLDTTFRELVTYEVEILVLDATADAYTIQWVYRNMATTNSHPMAQKIVNLNNDMRVVFRTDETGVFEEVVNWKEVRDYILKSTKVLRKSFKDIPEMKKKVEFFNQTFSTKEAIESASIKDILQFHLFYGDQYKLGEVEEQQSKVTAFWADESFDVKHTFSLEEINEPANNYVLLGTQSVNEAQMKNALFNYLTEMAKSRNVDGPKREELGDMKNETVATSRIHGSGWIINSVQVTTVTSENSTNIEERSIVVR